MFLTRIVFHFRTFYVCGVWTRGTIFLGHSRSVLGAVIAVSRNASCARGGPNPTQILSARKIISSGRRRSVRSSEMLRKQRSVIYSGILCLVGSDALRALFPASYVQNGGGMPLQNIRSRTKISWPHNPEDLRLQFYGYANINVHQSSDFK